MKVIFMGTPDFSVPTLESLIKEHEVLAVVTQPDRPKGRGKHMAFPPVKETALAHGLPVYQPARVRDDGFIRTMENLAPDVIVVVAFGQILPQALLELPAIGCINVHASLLPRYRGAAPIQWAVINGEKESGVTTMFMDAGLDTGDMLDQLVVPLDPDETGESLHDKLSEAGGRLILETLRKLEAGTAVRISQDDSLSTYAGMLNKEMGQIDWTRSAIEIERLVRGLNSWPSAYTFLGGRTLKIWEAKVVPEGEMKTGPEPGTIGLVTKDAFYVKTGQGSLAVRQVQLQGKKRMAVDSFLRGYPLSEGTRLGE